MYGVVWLVVSLILKRRRKKKRMVLQAPVDQMLAVPWAGRGKHPPNVSPLRV